MADPNTLDPAEGSGLAGLLRAITAAETCDFADARPKPATQKPCSVGRSNTCSARNGSAPAARMTCRRPPTS